MTAQQINVGNIFGEPTAVKHFGYCGADGSQTDIALIDHAGSGQRLYQIQGGKYVDLTDRIPAGETAADLYALSLASVSQHTTPTEFVTCTQQ